MKVVVSGYEELEKIFSTKGCKILTPLYRYPRQTVEYVCKCGNKGKVVVRDFLKRTTDKCKICSSPSIEEIKKVFFEKGCTLLSTEYVSSKPLEYVCKCGRRAKSKYGNFKKATGCIKCGARERASKRKFSLSQVRAGFKSKGWVLLENEYKNTKTKMLAICPCGVKHKASYETVIKGVLCPTCGASSTSRKLSGENSYLYNPFLSPEERKEKRNGAENNRWKKAVKKLFGNKCLACNSGEKLEAHHILPFRDFKTLRREVLNGVCFCKSCHAEFHKRHGRELFGVPEFLEFLNFKKIDSDQKFIKERLEFLKSKLA